MPLKSMIGNAEAQRQTVPLNDTTVGVISLPTITIKNLPEATVRALKIRAARRSRTIEAEICDILENAARPAERVKLGSELAALGREFGGVELDIERDKMAGTAFPNHS